MNAVSRPVVRWAFLSLAVASFFLLLYPPFVSGETWLPEERLTNDPSASGSSSITADLSGDLHVVWHDERDGNFEIYHRRWSAGIWMDEERLTFDGATSAWPVICTDRAGRAHVVWYDYRLGSNNPQIFCKHWDGFAWTPDEQVSLGGDWAVSPTIVVDPLNVVHAIWYDNRNGGDWEIYHRQWNDGTWGSEQRVTESLGESRYPAATVDELGNIYLVWQDRRDGNWEIYLKRCEGSVWGPDERLTEDPHNSLRPEITADVVGNLWVVWYDDRDGHSEIYYKRFDGFGWTPDTRLSDEDEYTSSQPAAGADRNGRVYVVWRDSRNGSSNSELYFKAWDGISWSEDERVTDDPASSTEPAITVDPLGAVQLSWEDTRDGNFEIYHKSRSVPVPPGPPPTVEGFSPPFVSNFGSRELTVLGRNFGVPAVVRLIPEVGPAITGTTIQVTATSVLARFDLTDVPVGWWSASVMNHDGQADTLGNCLQVIPSAWGGEARLTADPGGSSLTANSGHAMTYDRSGGLHLFWFDSRDGNQEIYTKTCQDSVWSSDERLTANPGQSSNPVTALAGDGSILLAWEDTRDGNAEIYTKSLRNDGWTEDARLTSNVAPSLYPSMTTDPSGAVHLVWQDGRTGTYQIYYSRSTSAGWTEPVRITHTSSSSVYPTVASDSHGRIYVAWTDARDGNWEIYFTRFAGGGWEAERRVTFDLMTSAYPSIATDGETCYLAWQDQRNGREEVFFRRLDIEDSDHLLVSNQGASRSPMLAVSEDRQVHIVWSDTRTGIEQIWYKVFNPSDGTWSLDHRMTGSGQEAVLPSIVAGAANSIVVVWRDSRDNNTEIYARARRKILPADTESPWEPGELTAVRCAPNPFRDSLVLSFRLPEEQQIVLRIFDVQGRRVRTLHDGVMSAGIHEIRWDGAGDDHQDLGPGVYFYRLGGKGLARGGTAVRIP